MTEAKNPKKETTQGPEDDKSYEKKKKHSKIFGLSDEEIKALKNRLEDAKEFGKAIKNSLTSRDNVIMVRVNDDSREKMDMLVEAGIFKSRSECAAFLIHQGIEAQEPLLANIKDKVGQIQKIREELKGLLKIEEKQDN